MTWTKNILVVANVTAISNELEAALRAEADRYPAAFYLIVPATPLAGGRVAARDLLRVMVERLRADGLRVDGEVGDCDPVVAVMEAWDPKRYDGVVVSTLPMRVSKWLHRGLPERIAQVTGAPVKHVVCRPPGRRSRSSRRPGTRRARSGRCPSLVGDGVRTRPSRSPNRSWARQRRWTVAEPSRDGRAPTYRLGLLVVEGDRYKRAAAIAEHPHLVVDDPAAGGPGILVPAGGTGEVREDAIRAVGGAEVGGMGEVRQGSSPVRSGSQIGSNGSRVLWHQTS